MLLIIEMWIIWYDCVIVLPFYLVAIYSSQKIGWNGYILSNQSINFIEAMHASTFKIFEISFIY